jgi:uncharacterized membrane protein YeiH
VTAAMTGAVVFTLGSNAEIPAFVAALAAFLVAFGIRGGALFLGWSFPPYRSRPGRPPEDIG